MHKILSTTALVMVAGAASAQEVAPTGPVITGEIETVIAETAAGDFGATTSFGLDVMAGPVGTGLEFAVNDGALELDAWAIGAEAGDFAVSFGDQGNMFVEGENGGTLEDPAMAESIAVSYGSAAVALGFTSITTDVTDIENVQGMYFAPLGVIDVTASGDYNFDTAEYVVGSRVVTQYQDYGIGGTMTYGSASENIAFEADATAFGVTAYINGDQDDMAQNIGGSYEMGLGNLTAETALNYDIDGEVFEPKFTVGFAF